MQPKTLQEAEAGSQIKELVESETKGQGCLSEEQFRRVLLKIQLGISPRASRKLYKKISCQVPNENNCCTSKQLMEFLEPWYREYQHLTGSQLLKQVLLQVFHGHSPPQRSFEPILKPVSHEDEEDILKIFFEPNISVLNTFKFPSYRDQILPHSVNLQFKQKFILPMSWSNFIHYFGTSVCTYSIVDHTYAEGLADDIRLTTWCGDPREWSSRKLDCKTVLESVPSFIPISLIQIRILQRTKYITQGASLLHSRTELLNGPFSDSFFFHEVWEILEDQGTCTVSYSTGMEWRKTTWFQSTIEKAIMEMSTRSTLMYVKTISEKFREMQNTSAGEQPFKPSLASKQISPTYLQEWLFTHIVIFLCIEFVLTYFGFIS